MTVLIRRVDNKMNKHRARELWEVTSRWCDWLSKPSRLNLPGNHALPRDDSDLKHYYLDGNKRSKANFVRITCCPWTTEGVDRKSVHTLEAAQKPRLTAKETAATQKLDPKQALGSKGAIKFCANKWGL